MDFAASDGPEQLTVVADLTIANTVSDLILGDVREHLPDVREYHRFYADIREHHRFYADVREHLWFSSSRICGICI